MADAAFDNKKEIQVNGRNRRNSLNLGNKQAPSPVLLIKQTVFLQMMNAHAVLPLGGRGTEGVWGLFHAHRGCCVSVAGTHHHGKTGSALLLCLRLGVHLRGVGWDRERTQQMTMGLSVYCRMSATQQGLFLNEVSHSIGIKYLLSDGVDPNVRGLRFKYTIKYTIHHWTGLRCVNNISERWKYIRFIPSGISKSPASLQS